MNRITVVIERSHPDAPEAEAVRTRTEVDHVFVSPHFTRDEVLDVFESALKGAGYLCDALIAEPETPE